MNKNFTALILIVLAVGIYFTFTKAKIEELKAIRTVNADYEKAISDSEELIALRDKVLKDYQAITPEDRDRLNKIIPDNVDNVRLIIDVKDSIALAHGLVLKDIKTTSPDLTKQTGFVATPAPANTGPGMGLVDGEGVSQPVPVSAPASKYGFVTMSFTVTTSYQKFTDFLRDMEASLRLMDVTKLTIESNAATATNGTYDFKVEVKTYWLK